MMIPGIPYYKSDIDLSVPPEEFFTSLKAITSRYEMNPTDYSEVPREPTFDESDKDYIADAPFVGKVSKNNFRIRHRPKAREIPPIVVGRVSSSRGKIEFTVFIHPAEVILNLMVYFGVYLLWRDQFGSFGPGGIVVLITAHLFLYFTAFRTEAKELDETLRALASRMPVQHGRRH
jgi:hypothetical protein